MQKRVAPKLKKIICVSTPSKEDVIDEFHVDPNKIEVILNGIDINISIANSIEESIKSFSKNQDSIVLITGSLYLVGEVLNLN